MSGTLAGAPLRERIERAWPGLSPQEQRVADFLRARPDESALYNSSELARLTGVSKATVSRLFRRLGFADSAEARELLRAQRGGGLRVAAGAEPDLVTAHLIRDLEHLRRLHGALDGDAVAAASAAIAAARRVLVAGARSGAPAAVQLRQALGQARPGVRLLPEQGSTVGEGLADLTAEDVVVLVAPRSAGAGRLLGVLVASPARVVVIGEQGVPAGAADWRFGLPGDPGAGSSVAAASLVGLLADAVLHALGDRGAARRAAIAAADDGLEDLGPR